MMHLKAAAQTIGLDSGTLGWAMLEKLVLDVISDESGMRLHLAKYVSISSAYESWIKTRL
jgi:hypothetical protein